MSVTALTNTPVSAYLKPTNGTASDGDSAAVEAAETAQTKSAEKNNGGIAPTQTGPLSTSGLGQKVNLLA